MSETAAEEPQAAPEPEATPETEEEKIERERLARFRWATRQGGPSQLLDNLYIGNYADAGNFDRLKELSISHVVNCAPVKDSEESPYSEDVGILGYMQIAALDNDECQILPEHYPAVKTFIDNAREDGGKVLVHCAMGTNRSGAICTAYIVETEKMDLISAMKMIKEKHGMLVVNKNFQKQLLEFAKARDLFVLKKKEEPAPEEGEKEGEKK